MSNEHFKVYAAVFPLLINDKGEILLHLRQKTGYMDGYWDLAGTGHLEPGETATEALIRECREELGIEISPNDIALCHTVHRVGQTDGFPYLYLYFKVTAYKGQPEIMEPSKNAALKWFDVSRLPEQMIDDRKIAVLNSLSGRFYDEWRT